MNKRSSLASAWRLMRPLQWSKNAIVFAGVVFSGQALDPGPVLSAAITFVAFCLASSAVYVYNDWHDREEDRLHPTKRWRPVASGEIAPRQALVIAGVLALVSILVALGVSPGVTGVVVAYLALMLVYTLVLREVAIVDILGIAGGFLLRAWAGAIAVEVPLSTWLLVCTLLLALLLGLGKRRHELNRLHFHVEHHRPSLSAYARLDLDRIMLAVGGLTVLAYAGYAVSVPSFGRDLPMVLTFPFAAFGIARYLNVVFRRNQGGSPELLLIHDRPLLIAILLWCAAVGLVLTS